MLFDVKNNLYILKNAYINIILYIFLFLFDKINNIKTKEIINIRYMVFVYSLF